MGSNQQGPADMVVLTGAFPGVAEERVPQNKKVAIRADCVLMVEHGRFRPEKVAQQQGRNIHPLKLSAEEQRDSGKEMTVLHLASGQTVPVVESVEEVVQGVRRGLHLIDEEQVVGGPRNLTVEGQEAKK